MTTQEGNVYKANFIISAVGGLCQPSWPKLDGAGDFQGEQVHTARWPKSLDLKNKKVGVIGTGCSSAQLVPAIQPIVDQLVLFQRTPAIVGPKVDQVVPEVERRDTIWHYLKNLYRYYTLSANSDWFWMKATHKNMFYSDNENAYNQLRGYMVSSIQDPKMQKKVLPDYKLGTLRPIFSSNYLQTFNESNFRLVTDGIEKILPNGIKTTTGDEVGLDVIAYATGFDSMGSTLSFETIGRNGKSLKETWDGNPSAYKVCFKVIQKCIVIRAFMSISPFGVINSSLVHSCRKI